MAKEGADSATQQGNDATGTQALGQGSQTPNANAMCAAQAANNARAANGAPIPGKYQKCATDAGKCGGECKGCGADKAKSDAQKGAQGTSKENADRTAEGAQQGQKCEQSKQNESKMPQMPQIPQMPQQQQQSSTPTDSTINTDSNLSGSDTSTNTSSALSPEVSSVDFGKSPANGGIVALPIVAPSQLSGSQASGGTNGAGQGLATTNGSAFQSPTSNGSGNGLGSYQSGGGSSGGLGSGSGASLSKSTDGIAGADIKPESSAVGEYNIGGGKSVLGLKGKAGDDEDTPAKLADAGDKDALAKALADAKAAADAKNKRGTSSSNADKNDDGSSLFTMVRNRYKTLKELGSI